MSAVQYKLPHMNSLMSRVCVRSPSGFPTYLGLAETYGLPTVRKSYLSDHFASCKSLYHRDLLGHFGCVNAIEFSNNGGEFVVSGGDDRRVMVWNVEKCVYGKGTPIILKGEHRSNIFCAVFDNDNSHIFSAGNDNQALLHDLATQEKIGMYYHDDPVYGLSVHPEDSNVFLTACDDGNVLLWDARTTSGSSECIAHYTSAFHAAVFNPVDPHLIATANSRSGVQLWDIRVPKNCLQQFSNAMPELCAMGLKWNMTGHVLTALRRRLPPVLYHISRPSAIAEFHHPGYSNVCTMKSNCFAGSKDQYVVSGSDDFNVYIWEVPPDWEDHEQQITVGRAFLVLHGHRSIVNQVRFNPATHMLISAGVEKVVKVWSPFSVPGGHDSSKEGSASSRRQLYSHSDYLGLIRSRGLSIPYEHARESTEEDPCMLAFFDSLIDREKNDSLSDSYESIGDDFNLSFILQGGSEESSDSDSVGISVNRLREILYQPSEDSPFGGEDGGVLRRLRRLTHSAAIRDLLHAAVDTTSSSSGSDEEDHRVQVALPDVPRDEANENHNNGNLQVRFRRRQARRNRNYRRQCRTQVETSTSGSSEVMSDSSSSSSEDESVQPGHSTELRNSPYRNDDNSSSSSSTEGSEHWISDNTPKRVLIRQKRKLSQERGESSLNGLQGHENIVGDNHESRKSNLTDSSSSCSTSLCSERASKCTCSASINRDSSCGCEARNGSLSQVQPDSVSRNCVDTDSNDKSCVTTPEECNKNRHFSNGLTGLSANHVPLQPENKYGPGGKGQEAGDASAQTKK